MICDYHTHIQKKIVEAEKENVRRLDIQNVGRGCFHAPKT